MTNTPQSSKTEVAILQASPDYPIQAGEWVDAKDYEQLRAELETERIRLAACGTAALGYFTGCEPQYNSASLQDVLRLREAAYCPQCGKGRDMLHICERPPAAESRDG